MLKRIQVLISGRQLALMALMASGLTLSAGFLPAQSSLAQDTSSAAASNPVTSTTTSQSGSYTTDNADIRQLDSLLQNLQTFRSNVRQLIVENTGGVLEESDILFMLKRPHGFYWETLQPFPELIVTDGETLWNYQPDLLQLSIENWDASRSELAAQLLSGNTEAIVNEYSVTAVPVDLNGTTRHWEFLLNPKDPASLYEQVSLYFEQGQLVSILLINTNGQRTFWEFNDREINIDLDASIFRFETPDDEFLDIVDKR